MSKRKKTDKDGPNSDICEMLLEIGEHERLVNRNTHKYNAYRNAASAISEHPTRIKSGKEAKSLKGVGEKIAEKIDEFLETGKLDKLEKIRKDETSQAMSLLSKVSGIGPVAAAKFVKDGITTIEDLKQNLDKLNHHQQIGVKYFDDFEKKIPRSEMESLEEKIVEACKETDKRFKVTICGSYRRGLPESGDIDVLITHPEYTSNDNKKPELLKSIVNHMEDIGLVTDTISLGATKFMGVCQLQKNKPFRRIDIGIFPCDQYHCATLYFTGNGPFNQQMRKHALDEGYTLNEFTLRPIGSRGTPGEPVPIHSEKDIFSYINFPYKKPTERNF